MANNKVQLANGTVLIDITDTTANASDVLSGEYFYDASGVKTEGSLIIPSTYTVTKTLTNVTTSNNDTEVLSGSSFYMDLTPSSGMVINSIIVTMGGVDVTEQVFKAGVGGKIITQNGVYDAEDDWLEGYSSVNVNVQNSYTSSDEGKVVNNGSLVSQTSATYTTNNTYDTTLINSVTVNVSGGITPTGTKQISISSNGTTTEDVTNYASAEISVAVPNSYSASDEGKVVNNGTLVSQTSDTVTQNGTVDTTLINSLLVNVSGGSSVKTGTVTPSTASTTISFDAGLSTITGILVMPINTPLTGSRTQAAMICLPSGSFYKAISIHTNSGGTGWVSPSVYTSNRYSLSGTTVTVTGAYNFRPAVGYIWYAW